jgi:hypothetical protein
MPRSENSAIIVVGLFASRQENAIPFSYSVNGNPRGREGLTLARMAEEADLVAARPQLLGDAEGGRDVPTAVPGDEPDVAHAEAPFVAGSSAVTRCLIRSSVWARDKPRSRRSSFQV